jgi:hypothetical protein
MHHRTRRDLIRTGIVGAAGAVAGGAVLRGPALAIADPLAGARSDAALLARIAAIEQLIAFAYDHVIAAVPLSGRAAATLREFSSHEHAHVSTISRALANLGSTPPVAPTSVDQVSARLAALHGSGNLASLKREAQALPYLVGVETVAEGIYYSAISKLSDPGLVVLAAGILACEAQHWSTLNDVFSPGDIMRSVPYSTVHG